MMFGDEMRGKMKRMMVLPMVVLLACGCAVTTHAKELASDKDKPHIVGAPLAWGGGEPMEPIRWSKANKDGVRIVLLSWKKPVDFDQVVLVRKNGTLVKKICLSIPPPLLDDKVEFIWLSDSYFAVAVSGVKNSSYNICSIDWEPEDTRPYVSLESGKIVGSAQFSFKDGVFRVEQGNKIIVAIPWKTIEPKL